MDRWLQTKLFVRIARVGSISKAGAELGLSNAAASRYLNMLEERLGARLIERTTRRLWLTEAGRTYLRYSESALSQLEEGEAAVDEGATEPVGELRVTTSIPFAVNYISPALPEFYRRYPRLTVNLLTENKYQNFFESGIDVAIRTRQFEPDSSITIKKLGESPLILAASPSYLASHGKPVSVEDLANHKFLIYTLATNTRELRLTRGRESRIVPTVSVFTCNDGQVIRSAALAGTGVMIQPLFYLQEDIQAGRLVRLLEDWRLPMLTINLAYQSRLHQPAKIKAFGEFMTERIAQLVSANTGSVQG